MGADNLVNDVHIRFLPDGKKLDGITSKTMKAKCSLMLHLLQQKDGTYTTPKGEIKKRYKYVLIGQPEVDPEESDEPLK
jgi:hypothetical protein